VFDATVVGSARPVDISDLRRYTIGLYAFPIEHGKLRPYAGLGLAINVIQNAVPRGTFSSVESHDGVFQRVSDQSSRASAILTGGLQYQVGRSAWFGQLSTMPTRNNFLISGSSHTFVFEFGVRYNLVG